MAVAREITESENFLNDNEVSLEQALKCTRYGKFNIFVVLVIGLSVIVNVAENINVSLIVPYARCDLNITTTEQSILNAASFAGILVSSHAWGFLADTWGRQKVLRSALTGLFVFSVMSSFSPTTAILITLRFVAGAFVAGIQASVFSYVSEFHSKKTMMKAVSIVASFMPAAFIFLPIIARFLFTKKWKFVIFGWNMSIWRVYLLACNVLNLLVLILVLQLPESPKFLVSVGRKMDALNVLKLIYAKNTTKSSDTYPVLSIRSESVGGNLSETKGFMNVARLMWNQTWPIFVQPYVGKTVKMSFLIFLLFSIGHGSFMWFPDFFNQLQTLPANHTALTLCSVVGKENKNQTIISTFDCDGGSNMRVYDIIFLIGIIFTSMSLLISFYIEKIGKNNYVYGSLCLSSICGFLLIYITNLEATMSLMIAFLSCSLCAAILNALSVSMFPTNIRAMATCAILMFGRVGAVCGSILVGILLKFECNYIFYLFGSLLIVSMAVYFMLDKELKAEKSKNTIQLSSEIKENI